LLDQTERVHVTGRQRPATLERGRTDARNAHTRPTSPNPAALIPRHNRPHRAVPVVPLLPHRPPNRRTPRDRGLRARDPAQVLHARSHNLRARGGGRCIGGGGTARPRRRAALQLCGAERRRARHAQRRHAQRRRRRCREDGRAVGVVVEGLGEADGVHCAADGRLLDAQRSVVVPASLLTRLSAKPSARFLRGRGEDSFGGNRRVSIRGPEFKSSRNGLRAQAAFLIFEPERSGSPKCRGRAHSLPPWRQACQAQRR
jgi:hypothetical protein